MKPLYVVVYDELKLKITFVVTTDQFQLQLPLIKTGIVEKELYFSLIYNIRSNFEVIAYANIQKIYIKDVP